MGSERLNFVLLNDADAVKVAKAKTNKKMIQVICDILKETYEIHTGAPWDMAIGHDTKEEVTKVLMKSAQQYYGQRANQTTIRNINTLVKARKRYRIAFKEMLYRSVRWYADDNQRVAKNKNGYMAMLLRDIRTLMYWK